MAELTVTKGIVVELAYELFVENELQDSAPVNSPLPYLHGYNNLISGLEKALEGHREGDTVEATIEPEEAYGEYDESAVVQLDRDLFPANFPMETGRPIGLQDEEGRRHTGVITDFNERLVTVDLNHPMAGKTLCFKCQIVSLRPGTEAELMAGMLIPETDEGCGCSDCSSCSHHCH